MKKSRSGLKDTTPNGHSPYERLMSLSQIAASVPPTFLSNPLTEERKMLSPAPVYDDPPEDIVDIFERERSSVDGNSITNNLFKIFSTLSQTQRTEFLFNQLPNLIPKTQLSSIVIKLRAQLKVDPFLQLSYELISTVAKYLDSDSMLLARCVNRHWRSLLDPMDELWRTHVKEDMYSEFCNPNPSENNLKPINRLLEERYMRFAWFYSLPLRIDIPCHNRSVVTCLQVLEVGNIVASASDDGSVLLWQVYPPKVQFALLGHTGGVWAIHTIGNILLSGSTDRTLRLWNVQTGACLGTLRGHSSTVRCASLINCEDGKGNRLAVSGSRDTTLRIWDLETFTTRFVLEGHTAAVRCLAVEENILVSGSYDSTARIWDIATGSLLHILVGHMAKIYSIAIAGSIVATGAMDSNILIWDIKTGQCLSIFEGLLGYDFLGMRGIIGSLSFLDSERLISSSTDGSVRIWSLKSSGECIFRLRSDNAAAVSFLQANKAIVIAGSDRILRMWETRSGKHVRDLINDVDTIWRLAFDKNFCVVGCLKNGITTLSFLYFGPGLSGFR